MSELILPEGGFRVIVNDPPWDFDDKGSRMVTPYETMTPEEILALPIIRIAAPRSHLYLWVTDAHLELGLQCVKAWGFKYKQTIIWEKVDKKGKPRLGAGHWFRHSHEICLFGVAGKLRGQVHNLPSVFRAPRTKHSAKPEVFFDIVDKMSPPGPRLEMFARGCGRPDWTVWGNEARQV